MKLWILSNKKQAGSAPCFFDGFPVDLSFVKTLPARIMVTMKQKLYLVRHGQTVYNMQHRVQGWSDSPLTWLGKNQAREAGDFFLEQGIRFDHAYSSDSTRAVRTMQIILRDNPCPAYSHEGLREMSWGKYDGAKISQLPDVDFDTGMKQFGGETRLEASRRVLSTICSLLRKPGHQTVLVVCHSIPLNYMAHTLPCSPEVSVPEWIPNGTILEYDVIGGSFLCQNIWLPS